MRAGILVLISGFVFAGCSQPPGSPDEADWRQIERQNALQSADYSDAIESSIRQHLVQYPNCIHRASAEEFYITRCTRDRSSCHQYFDHFPAGPRKSELEPVIWEACEAAHRGTGWILPACGDCCELYKANYPDGSRIEAVKQILVRESEKRAAEERERAAEERPREAESARAWSGRKIDLSLECPPAAGEILERVEYTVAGRTVRPEGVPPGTLSVPFGYPVAVRHAMSGWATVWPKGSTLRVPLSRVFVLYNESARSMWPFCVYEGALGEVQKEKADDVLGKYDEFWTLPGEHSVTCKFFGATSFAHDPSASVGTRFEGGELALHFDAPDHGGTVSLLFARDNAKIRGAVDVSPCWEDGPLLWRCRRESMH